MMLETLKAQLGSKIALDRIDEHTFQLYAPLFHEDGDMYSIYLDVDSSTGKIKLRDFGNTLMRLAYTFNIDTPNKEDILNNIVHNNLGTLDNGEIIVECSECEIIDSILRYSTLVSKVSNMDILQRKVVNSLFYDYLNSYIAETFQEFNPTQQVFPLKNREDLVVDWRLSRNNKQIYLFGVKDNSKAKDVTICCLEFQKANVPFTSVVVYEDMDTISKKERSRLINTSDKQYTSLESFKEYSQEQLPRMLIA